MKHGIIAKVARKVGRDRAVISRMLSGKNRPSWELSKKLALLYGTRPEFWMESTPAGMREFLGKAEMGEGHA